MGKPPRALSLPDPAPPGAGLGTAREKTPGWPLRRTLGISLLVMVAVFAGAVIVAGLSLHNLTQRVVRSSTTITRLSGTADRLLAAMLTQEVLVRTYTQTGEAPVKAQISQARNALVQTFADAERLPHLDATSRELLDRQRAIADRWWEQIARREIALRDSGQEAPLQQAVLQGQSRRQVEEFRSANTQFRDHLAALGRAESEAAAARVRATALLVILAIVIAGLAGLTTFVYVRHGVLRPLRDLTGAVAALRSGRLDVRVTEHGAREFRLLERSFNDTVAALQLAEEERRRLEQLKSDFIAIVSHELRTPLTSIKGYTEMVLDGDAGAVSEEQRDYLGTVLSNTDRLVDLVNDLLDLSRIESGRFEVERGQVDLAVVVESALRTLRPLIEAKGQELTVTLAPALPLVDGDARRLTQVAVNLISNACKYTPESGSITVEAAVVGGEVVLQVSDTGTGIHPDDQLHLFERFYRARPAGNRNVTGTGLGLAITRSIVELHGGRILVRSAPGQGSTFAVFLRPWTAAAAPSGTSAWAAPARLPARPAAVAE